MLGSIIGDIVGSAYEFNNIKTKDFPFFTERLYYTDDSVMTLATAQWLLEGGSAEDYYVKMGLSYPNAGYGGGFIRWLCNPEQLIDYNTGKHYDDGLRHPYYSCGNGSAMRISPVGWAFDNKEDVMLYAKLSAECTHNHPEGIKGAQAIALCILMARQGKSKEKIRQTITEQFQYDLSYTTDEIRDEYGWNSQRFGYGELCQASVPQAIVAFLDGNDFEDCVRNAISIGGDSDTIGCMTGSIAEAFYGIPRAIYDKGLSYLPQELHDIVLQFEAKYGNGILLMS